MTGLFDLFRIGIGPSSSHTVGPMIAAGRFRSGIPLGMDVSSIGVELFGSLALTGKGHATDVAVILGLLGEMPDVVDPDQVPALIQEVETGKALSLPGDERRGLIRPPTSRLSARCCHGIRTQSASPPARPGRRSQKRITRSGGVAL